MFASPPATASTTSEAPAPTPTEPGLETVVVVCGDADAPELISIVLDETGAPDTAGLWPRKLSCDYDWDSSVTTVTTARTPLQEAVVAATHAADKPADPAAAGLGLQPDDESVLYYAYQECAANDPKDTYGLKDELSDAQVAEIKSILLLCPTHPKATGWRANIARSARVDQQRSDGTRVDDGTYAVPAEMRSGTFVVTDVKDCYWETRDRDGKIVANNFVLAAPRVEARVAAPAIVFTSSGCGAWVRQ